MTSRDFKPLLNPTSAIVQGKKPHFHSFLIKDSFTLPTLLALGALIQTLTLALLPARYSLIPLAFLLAHAAIATILPSRSPTSNPLLKNIIPGRVTAQLPLPNAGSSSSNGVAQFGHEAASSPVVAFHLGVHFNHPLGLLAPGAKEIGAHFQAMTTALTAPTNRAEFGLLSTSTWRGTERASTNSILMVAYFKDVEGLNRFAHSKVHRDGWDWYLRFVRETGYRHLGIFHETFVSRSGDWEAIYADCEPTLLGAASVRVDGGVMGGGKAEEAWIRPLVSADHPALKTQSKRMGLALGSTEATGQISPNDQINEVGLD